MNMNFRDIPLATLHCTTRRCQPCRPSTPLREVRRRGVRGSYCK
jgi:hypothetical protein